MAACTSTSTVVATDNPNVLTVSANSRGSRMSWVGAYRKAVDSATDYCAKRGMHVSTKTVSMRSDGHELNEQGTDLTFECRPTF